LLVVHGQTLYLLNLKGGYKRFASLPTDSSVSGPLFPAWSPNGGTIAFTRLAGGEELPDAYLMDRRRHRVRLAMHFVGSPAWSPNGRFLVLVVVGGAPGPGTIVKYDVATRTSVPYSKPPTAMDSEPDWQPRCSVVGTPQKDRLVIRTAGRLVCTLGGNDTVTVRAGGAHVFTAGGDDSIHSRNGRFDLVSCGLGTDTVFADRVDRVASDCEARHVPPKR
jgi:hypothetical protein